MLVQVLEPTEPTIQKDEKGYYVKGKLMSTRPNERRWGLRKSVFLDKTKLDKVVIGKPFAIIPDLINAKGDNGGGHFYSKLHGQARYDELMKGYKDNAHGIITETYGPFKYPDDEDNYYYDYRIDLNNDKAASVLQEHGSKTWVPYSTSIHIWPLAGDDEDITDYDVFGTALVIKGAWEDTTLSKMCIGPASLCKTSLAASTPLHGCQCDQCNESLAAFLSSYIDRSASIILDNNKMSTDPTKGLDNTSQGQAPNTATVQSDIVNAKVDPTVDQLKAENERLQKIVEENKEKAAQSEASEKRIAELELESKSNAIERMFPSALITDSNVLTQLRDAYSKKSIAEVKGLETFLADLNKNYIPFVLESAKKQWVAENTKESKDSKDEAKDGKKDKSASGKRDVDLAPEPKSTDSEVSTDKSASTKPTINPVMKARDLLVGGKY